MPSGMEDPLGLALELAAAAVLLVTLRALGAAFEAALTALGVPRAEALAADPEAGVRARALGRVVSRPESSAAAMRLFVAMASLSAGALFAAAAAQLPAGAHALPMAGAVLLGALLTVALASAGRRVGAVRPEQVALLLAPLVRALTVPLAPVARLVGLAVTPLCGGPGRFTLPLPPSRRWSGRSPPTPGPAIPPTTPASSSTGCWSSARRWPGTSWSRAQR